MEEMVQLKTDWTGEQPSVTLLAKPGLLDGAPIHSVLSVLANALKDSATIFGVDRDDPTTSG